MEPEIQQRIEQTVLEILKKTDMEDMTEFKVRVMASEQLGINLSDTQCKKFIRGIVESFLLSTMEEEVVAGEDADPNFQQEAQTLVHQEPGAMPKKEFDSEGNLVICKLSNRRNVVIQDYMGKSFVSIREFYCKDGRQLPSNKGINLPAEQWSSFRKSVPSIEEAIMKMQSKLRSHHQILPNEQIPVVETTSTPCESNGRISNLVAGSHNELNGQASNLINTSMPHEHNGQVSKSSTASISHELNGHVSDTIIASTIQGIVPVEINRFDGKNYQFWAPVMELFLKQLNIAYVLTDPCPSVATRPGASAEEIALAKAAERKWLNDDSICRRNILVCLSDALYSRYSKKTKSAKELWEELKLVYLYEEFGQKRSLVKKYIEFQIVDEKPILEQVQELNSIADSIVTAGIFFDENFHISTIISKLPPSWKDFCMKLMCEEHLPFWILMDRVKVEEASRNYDKQAKPPSSACFNHAKNLGPRIKDMKKPGVNGKRQETDTDNKVLVCYFCGKKGHISKHCRNKKFRKENPCTTGVTENAVTETKTEQC